MHFTHAEIAALDQAVAAVMARGLRFPNLMNFANAAECKTKKKKKVLFDFFSASSDWVRLVVHHAALMKRAK